MPLLFVLLNPSTANEFENDPTVSRCIKRARRMGFGGVEVCNLYALRSTEPSALYNFGVDTIGAENLPEIVAAAQICSTAIVGWGIHGEKVLRLWPLEIMKTLRRFIEPTALGINKDGSPVHPLYVSYNTEPKPFRVKDF